MPKIVDRAERRREIAGALLRIVAREGVEAVSVRSVAVEAGVSAGAVQKYFSTKEDLFRFALDMTSEFLEQRWKTLDQSGNLLDLLLRLLVEAMPLDEQRRAEVIVINAFTARAAVRPSWAEFIRTGYDELAEITTEYISKAQSAGHVRDDLTASDLADAVLALSDGFANRMLTSADPAALLPSLETSVRTLLGPTHRN
ncbi:TetR/AcrR family transcriptional regulator [Amycolatopsis sp. NPDC052450]|uniref:TetR/AcrR family transcriptional regulator n=1 Tax=Amycolatopsis sp. NPDC052450 TaxID=3363937 RepID=UPI0037C811A0